MTSSSRFRVFENRDTASAQIASEMAVFIRERAILGRTAVLGIAESRTLSPLHQELAYLHREEGLSFRNVVVFLLAEYQGLPAGHPSGLRNSLQRALLDHIDVPPENVHGLSGRVSPARIASHCAAYEERIAAAGGLDWAILGLGRNGRIAFNEPGTPVTSRTRAVEISGSALRDTWTPCKRSAVRPTAALTLGCANILEARRVLVLAAGPRKTRIVPRVLFGPPNPAVPASWLQAHPSAHFFLTQVAAADLQLA